MKILVPTKRVPDTDQKIRVREDGPGIETANLPFVINPFDAIAIEEAIRIRESQQDDVEVVAIGIGSWRWEPIGLSWWKLLKTSTPGTPLVFWQRSLLTSNQTWS